MPIIVLEDLGATRILPIWIGEFEANAIALTMERVPTPRPMTHDLMKNLLTRLGIEVDRIVVTDVRNNTFYASIHCRRGGDMVIFDSRPSDAIALALRTGSPIYVEDTVVVKSHDLKSEDSPESGENIRKWLESIAPEILGKYKM